MPRRRRRSWLCRILSIVGGVLAGLLLLCGVCASTPHCSPGSISFGLGADSWRLQQPRLFPSPPELFTPPPTMFQSSPEADFSFARRLLPFRHAADQSAPQHEDQDDAVLLPDQEVLVLTAEPCGEGNAMCSGGCRGPGATPTSAPCPDCFPPRLPLHLPRPPLPLPRGHGLAKSEDPAPSRPVGC